MSSAARRKRPPKARAPTAAAPARAPVASVPPPRFVTPVPDSPVELERPVEYAGRTFARITRRRPSSAVLGEWFERVKEAGPETPNLNLPIFVDDAGTLVPDEVLGFLDDDDRQRVFGDADPFMPRRLGEALAALTEDPAPSLGDASAPTSSVSSAAPAPN